MHISLPAELEGQLRDSAIRSALEEAHYVSSISREVTDQPRTRLGAMGSSGSLDPRTMLKLYMDSKGVPEDRASVLMRRAQELMEEPLP